MCQLSCLFIIRAQWCVCVCVRVCTRVCTGVPVHHMVKGLCLVPVRCASRWWSIAVTLLCCFVPYYCLQGISQLTNDFAGDRPLYKAVHIFFLESMKVYYQSHPPLFIVYYQSHCSYFGLLEVVLSQEWFVLSCAIFSAMGIAIILETGS